MNRKISIILAAHDQAEYIGNCLDSLLTQTIRDIEILAVDCGSTDGTGDILYEDAHEDERVVFLADRRGSIGHAKNLGLDRARTPYIMIPEPEDCLHKDVLERLCRELDQNPDLGLAACGTEWVGTDAYGRTREDRMRILREANQKDNRQQEINSRLLRSWSFTYTTVYRRDFLEMHGIRHFEEPGYGRQDSAFRLLAMMKGAFFISEETGCERRVDRRTDRITDPRSVTDICSEFRFLRERLMEEDALWNRERFIFWQAFYDRNLLLYEELADTLKPRLAGRMQAELKGAIEHREFDPYHFDAAVRPDMELLISDAKKFDQKQRERLKEREHACRETARA
ncbi:MAG: glycosyltransferase [Lachnospiraceae bacterium]|nr:glycosyltransferase [Lachnospiraceae bacterium]